ncbi:C protein [Bat paramyxovirus]|nr:C protein [Bat paramyxovirus]
MVSRLLNLFRRTGTQSKQHTVAAPLNSPRHQIEQRPGNSSSAKRIPPIQDHKGSQTAKMEIQKQRAQYLMLILEKVRPNYRTHTVRSVRPMIVEITTYGMLKILLNQMTTGPMFIYRTLHLLIEDGILTPRELMNLKRAIRIMTVILENLEITSEKELAQKMITELNSQTEEEDRL